MIMFTIDHMDLKFKSFFSNLSKFVDDTYAEYESELKVIVKYLFGEQASCNDLLLRQLFQFLEVSRKVILEQPRHHIKSVIKMANTIIGKKLTAIDEDRIYFETLFTLVLYHENCEDIANMLYFDADSLLYDYPTFEQIVSVDNEEIIKLLFFRNWMKVVLLVIPPYHNKGRILNVVTRICEGDAIKYVTGGGQNDATERRVLIYEQEGNITKKARPKRKIKESIENESESESESESHMNDLQNQKNNVLEKICNRSKVRISQASASTAATDLKFSSSSGIGPASFLQSTMAIDSNKNKGSKSPGKMEGNVINPLLNCQDMFNATNLSLFDPKANNHAVITSINSIFNKLVANQPLNTTSNSNLNSPHIGISESSNLMPASLQPQTFNENDNLISESRYTSTTKKRRKRSKPPKRDLIFPSDMSKGSQFKDISVNSSLSNTLGYQWKSRLRQTSLETKSSSSSFHNSNHTYNTSSATTTSKGQKQEIGDKELEFSSFSLVHSQYNAAIEDDDCCTGDLNYEENHDAINHSYFADSDILNVQYDHNKSYNYRSHEDNNIINIMNTLDNQNNYQLPDITQSQYHTGRCDQHSGSDEDDNQIDDIFGTRWYRTSSSASKCTISDETYKRKA